LVKVFVECGRIGAILFLSFLAACGDDNKESGYYSIGGTITGLDGSGLVLQNNSGDDLVLDADGGYSFATKLEDGTAYEVTIAGQPDGQTCSVINGSGTVEGGDITNIVISCPVDAAMPSVSAASPKVLRFTWNDVGADHYRLLKNPDGNSGYTQVGGEITTTTVDEEISVHLTDWVNASYLVQACNAVDVCTDSTPITATSFMLDAIGYLKELDTYDFGKDVAISDDANTLAISSGDYVYVYQRNGALWSLQARLDYSLLDDLALSSSGDTLALGYALGGTVYILQRSGTTWSQQTHIEASNTESSDWFGTSVSLSASGDLLAVADFLENSAATGINGDQTDISADNAGAVYIYERRDNDWQQQAYIKASNTDSEDQFGAEIALSADGNTLAVASPYEDSSATGINGDQSNSSSTLWPPGAVYVFTRTGTDWLQQAYVKASNTDEGWAESYEFLQNDDFGESLALSRDGATLVIGAWNERSGDRTNQHDNSSPGAGAVYLY
jgi:hypothetical protein